MVARGSSVSSAPAAGGAPLCPVSHLSMVSGRAEGGRDESSTAAGRDARSQPCCADGPATDTTHTLRHNNMKHMNCTREAQIVRCAVWRPRDENNGPTECSLSCKDGVVFLRSVSCSRLKIALTKVRNTPSINKVCG